MKSSLLMKIDVETLYPFIRKKSPRHIDPKIPSHGGTPPPYEGTFGSMCRAPFVLKKSFIFLISLIL